MKQIYLFHDAFTSPTDTWYQAVQSILPSDYTLITPELPAGTLQGMEFWKKAIDTYLPEWNTDTILITHGISSLLALRALEEISQPIRMYISISGCAELPQHKVYLPIAESFLQTPITWDVVKSNTKNVVHFWNQQDPVIAANLSEHFAELLPGEKIVFQESGHMNGSSEYSLLEQLQNLFEKITVEDEKQARVAEMEKITKEKQTLAAASIPAVVTYDTDVAESVAGYQGKVISELLETARLKEKEKKLTSPKNPKNILYIAGTIIIAILGLGIIIYSIVPSVKTFIPQATEKQYKSKLLRLETAHPLELSGKDIFALRKELFTLQNSPIDEKTFSGILPLSGDNYTNLEEFIDAYDLTFPLGFAGKTDDFLYGYYREDETDTAVPFLLVRFEGYDLMFQIMKNWEAAMISDTLILFHPDETTPGLIKPEAAPFSEIMINNILMRQGTIPPSVIEGEEYVAQPSLAYGFLSDETLLITPDPTIAEALLRRMIGR